MKNVSLKIQIAEKNRLIASFKKIAQDYPGGGYEQSVAKLESERAALVSKIGR